MLIFALPAHPFDNLHHRIKPFIRHERTHSNPVSLQERLAVTLRLLASGSSQKCCAASYKLGVTTVSGIISEMCAAIWQVLKDDFVPLPKGTDWADIARDFWRVWNFPNCLGCIDGKHVTIRAQPNAGSDYFNYKRRTFHRADGHCDANCHFTMVEHTVVRVTGGFSRAVVLDVIRRGCLN